MRQRVLAMLAVAIVAVGVGLFSGSAFAATDPFKDACAAGGGGSSACGGGGGDPLTGTGGALTNVVNLLAIVGGIVAAVFVVIGGIKYITSNGDSSQVASAKSTIIYALIGVVVSVLARQLINFVLGRLKL